MTPDDFFTRSSNLPWIVTFLILFASGPFVYKELIYKGNYNIPCRFDERLTNLTFLEICDFDVSKDSIWTILEVSLGVAIIVSVAWAAITHLIPDPWKAIPIFILSIASAGCIAAMCYTFHNRLNDPVLVPKNTNWSNLRNEMKTSLHENFKEDNISSEFEISNQWNILFIAYECCGVDRVEGTTNDFDNTPWCTTSGSCQRTASQIPRSCCKNLNEFDYHSAPPTCHASVNSGTYHEKGCYSVIKDKIEKRTEKIREELNRVLDDMLKAATCVCLIMASYAVWFVMIAFVALSRLCCCCKKDPSDSEPNSSTTEATGYKNGTVNTPYRGQQNHPHHYPRLCCCCKKDPSDSEPNSSTTEATGYENGAVNTLYREQQNHPHHYPHHPHHHVTKM